MFHGSNCTIESPEKPRQQSIGIVNQVYNYSTIAYIDIAFCFQINMPNRSLWHKYCHRQDVDREVYERLEAVGTIGVNIP